MIQPYEYDYVTKKLTTRWLAPNNGRLKQVVKILEDRGLDIDLTKEFAWNRIGRGSAADYLGLREAAQEIWAEISLVREQVASLRMNVSPYRFFLEIQLMNDYTKMQTNRINDCMDRITYLISTQP